MMSTLRPLWRALIVAAALLSGSARPAHAMPTPPEHEFGGPPSTAEEVPPQLQDVSIDEHLGADLPRDLRLRDEAGRDVKVGDYFTGDKPVVLFFAYHSCPMLCGMVIKGVTASLREVAWPLGEKYEVLTVSIDPNDTPRLAAEKKEAALTDYGRDRAKASAGWHFLTGDAAEVKRLADAVGFHYYYDKRQKQFAHAAAMFVITPGAKIARYLYGIEFPPRDVRLALAEASEGRSISSVDHFLLYCYRYDPSSRGYVLYAVNVMRAGAAVTAIAVIGVLALLWRREARFRATTLAAGHEGATNPSPPATTKG